MVSLSKSVVRSPAHSETISSTSISSSWSSSVVSGSTIKACWSSEVRRGRLAHQTMDSILLADSRQSFSWPKILAIASSYAVSYAASPFARSRRSVLIVLTFTCVWKEFINSCASKNLLECWSAQSTFTKCATNLYLHAVCRCDNTFNQLFEEVRLNPGAQISRAKPRV
jgi:hypothetical protein